MRYKIKEVVVPEKIHKIYFVGIKGVGMAPLAIIAKGAGITISGSDVPSEFITDKYLNLNNLKIDKEFNEHDIEQFFLDTDYEKCLVITTGAHKGFDNPQVLWAKKNKIEVMTQGQALGVFSKGKIINRNNLELISVSGSHGKTTISSLLAVSLKALGYGPTYSVGTGEVFPIGPPGHLGSGNYFIAEADEYASEPVHDKTPKFLYLNPKYSIINNIDFDHPDIFPDIEKLKDAFLEFSMNINSDGLLFINGDDKYLQQIKDKVLKDIRVVSYGEGKSNNYVITKIITEGLSSRFTVLKNGKEFGVFNLNIPGIHNAKNSLAVIALLDVMEVGKNDIRRCLNLFEGTKRRSEILGKTNGSALVVDDYGHHPVEIRTTLKALSEAYPAKKIVCIFQPHTYSRTKALLPEFIKSFMSVDRLLLLPIFKSERDTEETSDIEDDYRKFFAQIESSIFMENFDSVVEYINQNFNTPDYLIVTMGAGDVYKIGQKLVNL